MNPIKIKKIKTRLQPTITDKSRNLLDSHHHHINNNNNKNENIHGRTTRHYVLITLYFFAPPPSNLVLSIGIVVSCCSPIGGVHRLKVIHHRCRQSHHTSGHGRCLMVVRHRHTWADAGLINSHAARRLRPPLLGVCVCVYVWCFCCVVTIEHAEMWVFTLLRADILYTFRGGPRCILLFFGPDDGMVDTH